MRYLLFVVVSLLTSTAYAEDPPFSDLAGREPIVPDLQPRPTTLSLQPSGHAELSAHVGLRQRDEGHEVRGMVTLSLPTDRWLLSARGAKEVHLAERGADEDAPPVSSGVPDVPRSIVLPRIRARDARAAISAALRATHNDSIRLRLDDLDTRARWSAVLPQVRLRATRLVDESTALSPTSYDADRTTARGGTSLWLEGRATWTLDRLVFADQELRSERFRAQLRDREDELTKRVTDALIEWQQHVQLRYDPLINPDACLRHAIAAAGLAVRLDLLTDGWFERWRRAHPLPRGDCQ